MSIMTIAGRGLGAIRMLGCPTLRHPATISAAAAGDASPIERMPGARIKCDAGHRVGKTPQLAYLQHAARKRN